MSIKQLFLGSLFATILFIVLNIVASKLPWGVENVLRTEIGAHEVDNFTENGQSSMNLILTEKSMSFVSTRDRSYYSMNRFFSVNMLLILCSAIFLCSILHLLQDQPFRKKMTVITLFGLFAITSIHLTYWNWWGFSTVYSIGVSTSTLINLLIVSFLLAKYIFKPVQNPQIG